VLNDVAQKIDEETVSAQVFVAKTVQFVMGRVSRHKKVKSCDPFFKGSKKGQGKSKKEKSGKDASSSQNSSALVDQHVPRKAKQIMQFTSGSVVKRKRKDPKKKNVSKVLEKKPWESKREFFDRVDEHTKEKMSQIMKVNKPLRQKRKEHLKGRKEKEKTRKAGEEDFKSEKFREDIKFGDVVEQPPIITTLPRKAAAKKVGRSELLLEKSLASAQEDSSSQIKKRKNMTSAEKRQFDSQRESVIQAYRLAKKRKMEMQK